MEPKNLFGNQTPNALLHYVEIIDTQNNHQQIISLFAEQIRKLETLHSDKTFEQICKESLIFKHYSWTETIKIILNKVYPNNIFRSIDSENTKYCYGKIWLNSKYQGKIIDDVLEFSFVSLYPNTLNKLYQKGDISFSNNKIGDLFNDLLKITIGEIEYFVHKTTLDESFILKIKTLKKYIINYFYGILASQNRGEFYCNDIETFQKHIINFMNIIIDNFKDDIIYVDTDEIYFRYTKNLNLEKFKEILEIIAIPYVFENGIEEIKNIFNQTWIEKLPYCKINDKGQYITLYNGLFMEKKKYIIFDKENKIIRTKGIQYYEDKKYNNYLDMKINRSYKHSHIE